MACMLKVHSDLVRPPCSNQHQKQGEGLIASRQQAQGLHLSPCRLSGCAHPARGRERLARLDPCVDDVLSRRKVAVAQHQVVPSEFVGVLLPAQGEVAHEGLSHQDEATTGHIKAVYDAKLVHLAKEERILLPRINTLEESGDSCCPSWHVFGLKLLLGPRVDFPVWRLQHHSDVRQVQYYLRTVEVCRCDDIRSAAPRMSSQATVVQCSGDATKRGAKEPG
mmetsp:Transcript_8261/g.19764  ORF Transcript_8261/g.19764 Transcript_8261/m.19764 type:complete len:222 (+) Transcript_8261:261-926(+)